MILRIGESLIGLVRKKTAVLDIGTRFVKLVVLEKRGQQLKAVGSACVPRPFAEEGKKNSSGEALTGVLSELVRMHKLKKSQIISALPRESVTVKVLNLPPAEPEKLKQMLEFETERYIPYPRDRVYYDFQILTHRPEGTRVLLVAVRKGILQRHLGVYESLGLEPKLVDVDCFANFNSLCRYEKVASGAVGYLEIGAGSSRLLLAVEGIPQFTQAVSFGGDKITGAIQKGLNLSREEAERQKVSRAFAPLSNFPADGEETSITAVIRPVLDKFASEVQHLLDYFRRLPGGTEVKQIVLSGGGALLPRFDDFLAGRLGIPVIIGEPGNGELARFSRMEKEIDPAQFAVALGMAMRETNQPVLTLNLIPPEIIKQTELRQLREKRLILGLATGGSIILASLILFFLQFFFLNWKVKRINQRIEILRPRMEEIRRLNEEKRNYLSGIETISEFTQRQISWLEIIRELSSIAPEEIWLTNLTFGREGTINVSGDATNSSSVRELESALKSSDYFDQVELLRIDARRTNLVSFRMNCRAAVGVEEESTP